MNVLLCCPRCGSGEHLSARQSITYDAYTSVRVTRDAAGNVALDEQRKPQLIEVETTETAWFVCDSEDCLMVEMQEGELVAWPRPFDLCARCDHHFEQHSDFQDPGAQDRPCQDLSGCGCEDFVLRAVPVEQPELHPGDVALAA